MILGIVTLVLLWSKIIPGIKITIKKASIKKKVDMIIKGKIVAGHIKQEDLEKSRIPIKNNTAVQSPQIDNTKKPQKEPKDKVAGSSKTVKPKDDELIF